MNAAVLWNVHGAWSIEEMDLDPFVVGHEGAGIVQLAGRNIRGVIIHDH